MSRNGWWYAGLAVWLLLLSGFQAPAEACRCSTAEPACSGVDPRFANEHAVFAGTVLSVVAVFGDSPIGRAEGIPNYYTIRLRVDEAFMSLGVKEIELSTNGSTSACGYEFTPGESYFVQASRSTAGSVFTVSRCSRTKPLAYARDEVELLRAAARGLAETRVFGHVWEERAAGSVRDAAGLKVVANGGGKEYTTVTDARGQFRFVNVPEGTYRIRAWLNESFSKEATLEPTLSAAQRCAQIDFGFRPGARIAGTVIDSPSSRRSGIWVLVKDVTPFGQREQGPDVFSTISSRDGRFEIDGLPPGRYVTEIRIVTANGDVRLVSADVSVGTSGAPTPILLLSPNENIEDVVIRVPNPN